MRKASLTQKCIFRQCPRFDVKPEECLILEDNDHGIEAAVASGGNLLKIGVPDDVTHQAIRARIDELNSA